MMKQMTRRMTAAMMALVLVAGMASGPALAGSSDTVTNLPVAQRNHTMGPVLSPVVQPVKGSVVAVNGPETAKQPTTKMSWGRSSNVVPRVNSLSPVFAEEKGYLGLSWRF